MMSDIKFTPSQAIAIDHSGANLLVAAAAGSGKTAVVAQRAVKLLTDKKVEVNKLLLITFTRAAAAQMRARVAAVLKEQIKKDNDPFLKKQLRNLPDADICTIDSYLTKLLRRNYHIVGIDPAFSVISEDEKQNISQRTIKKILRNEFDMANNDYIFLCDTLGGKGAKALNDIIINCYEYTRKYNNYIDFIKSWPEEYSLDEKQIKNSLWMKEAMRALSFDISEALSKLKIALKYASMPAGPSKYAETIEQDIIMVQNAVIANGFDEMKSAVLNIEFSTLPSKDKECDQDLAKKARKFRSDAKNKIKKIINSPVLMPISDTINRHKAMRPAISALTRLVLEYEKEMKRTKNRYKTLDFGDLMHYSLIALEDETVRQNEQNRYDFIFVDEYQDTNRLQETLINYITKSDNLFCVGDVKQSIYSFRQAEPALFIDRMDKSSDKLEGINHLVQLSENFRSSNAVVDFINIVFDNVMTRKTGGVDYVGNELLKCRARRPEGEDENAKVELIVIDAEQKENDSMLSNIEYEAIITADKIKEIISKPIFDGKLGTFRPAKYSDICILSRSFRPIVRPVRRILEQRGIPVSPVGETGYLDKLEIETAVNILRIIDNHHRDVALICAMRSPAFGFDINELIKIRKKYNDKSKPYYMAMEEYASKENDALSSRLAAFLVKLDKYRLMSKHMPLGEFIWFMLSDTMLYDAIGALPGGRVRQQNLRILAERADAFSMTPGRNLSSFLEHIINFTKSDNDFEPAQNTDNSDSVKFMSIHKSKGLEFPVVILINTASQSRGNTDSVVLSGGLAPGVKCYNPNEMIKRPTLSYEATVSNKKFIENAEKLRVLYVALTRARERLCIIGTIRKNLDNKIQSWALPKESELLFDKSFLDILGTAAIRIKGNEISSEVQEISTQNIHSKIIPANNLAHDKKKRKGAVLNAMILAKKTPYAPDAFSYVYKKERFTPAKTTATALLSPVPIRYEQAEFNDICDFMQEECAYDAAAKGTFTHTVMQHVAFNATKDEIEFTIEKLIDNNILPKDAKDAVNINIVERFIKSDIAHRIRKSNTIKREQPFVIKLDAKDLYNDTSLTKKVLVQGIIDICFIENNKWVIVDYKTNKVTKKNTPQVLMKHYKNQLSTYKKALEILTDKKVSETGIYFLSQDEGNAYFTL